MHLLALPIHVDGKQTGMVAASPRFTPKASRYAMHLAISTQPESLLQTLSYLLNGAAVI